MMGLIKKRVKNHFITNRSLPDISQSLRQLNSLGYRPDIIYDVGAYEGSFALLAHKIWQEANIYCFEPLENKIDILSERTRKSGKIHLKNVLLGDQEMDRVSFYEAETASSVLKEHHPNQFPSTQKPMRSLDSMIQAEGLPVPSLIKLDTQGYEYQILNGLSDNLAKVEIILAELNLIDIHKEVILADKVISFLSTFDFVPYDITELHHRPLDKALFQVDMIFVKRNSIFRSNKKWAV